MHTGNSPASGNLVAVLREGVTVVQMIIFKVVKSRLTEKFRNQGTTYPAMLTGGVVNELFGTPAEGGKFLTFRQENRAAIEQELLGFKDEFPDLLDCLTDALRVQVLCDNQDGVDSTALLKHAEQLGILRQEREVPLPSSFMTMVRTLGEAHKLIIPPIQISPEDDLRLSH